MLKSSRIFISDLPENIVQSDLQEKFSQFGKVSSVEVKQRKDIGPKNSSLYFAFINVEIDERSLQECFEEFSRKKWKGEYITLQLAKENFLDRLKREREDAKQNSTVKPVLPTHVEPLNIAVKIKTPVNGASKVHIYKSSSESDLDEETEVRVNTISTKIIDDEELSDMVFKNNKNKVKSDKLVIESVGNEPIYKSEVKSSKSLDPKRSEADLKRINSLLERKKGYNQQKLTIRSALAKVDAKVESKEQIIDKNVSKSSQNGYKKRNLFDGNEEDDGNYNFQVKQQYEGKKGQKLLEMQSKFKNDKRFAMDERFIDQSNYENNEEEESEVVGTNQEKHKNKLMLRFDPNQPEHSKYEIKDQEENENENKKKKRKREQSNEIILPEVSKETYYDVADNLKEALEEKEQFSLLNMFGKNKEENEISNDVQMEEESIKPKKKSSLVKDKNPFKYDSTDDEMEDDETDKKAELEKIKKKDKTPSKNLQLGTNRLWTESLFFKKDDYRFQDGMEFVKKLAADETDEIGLIRREIKQVVRAKVKNNERKNRPFKKKLGGSRKSQIKFKKALKR